MPIAQGQWLGKWEWQFVIFCTSLVELHVVDIQERRWIYGSLGLVSNYLPSWSVDVCKKTYVGHWCQKQKIQVMMILAPLIPWELSTLTLMWTTEYQRTWLVQLAQAREFTTPSRPTLLLATAAIQTRFHLASAAWKSTAAEYQMVGDTLEKELNFRYLECPWIPQQTLN